MLIVDLILSFPMLLFIIMFVIFRAVKAFECKDIKSAEIEIRTLHKTIEKLNADNENLTNAIKVHIISPKIIKLSKFINHNSDYLEYRIQ